MVRFALGYGGNGMTFASLAARVLLERWHGVKSGDHKLCRDERRMIASRDVMTGPYLSAARVRSAHARSRRSLIRAALAANATHVLRGELKSLRAQLFDQLAQNCSARVLLKNRTGRPRH